MLQLTIKRTAFQKVVLFLFIFIISLLFNSCSRKIQDQGIISKSQSIELKNTIPESFKIHFFGVTSFLIVNKKRALLTDPFISNPIKKEVVFGKIQTDTSIVNRYLKGAPIEKTKMVTIGHAHYDHLMDWPYISSKIKKDSCVLAGSKTAINTTFKTNSELYDAIALNEHLGNIEKSGKWIYSADSNIRVMGFEADHPSHFMGITLYKGDYSDPLESVPHKAKKWKMGQPISYIADFLDKETIQLRLFIQTSNGPEPAGYFPETILKEHPIDIALLSLAVKGKKIKELAKLIDYCNPKIVFLGHWENFMREKEATYKAVPKANISKHWNYLKDKYSITPKILLPKPGSTFTFND